MNAKRLALGLAIVALAAGLLLLVALDDDEAGAPARATTEIANPSKKYDRQSGSALVEAPIVSGSSNRLIAQSEQNEDGMLRSNYVRSAKLPDEVAFWAVMQKSISADEHHAELAKGWVRTEMHLSNSDAAAFLKRLEDTYDAYQVELIERSRMLACDQKIGAATREELYSRLEKLDDLNYSLAAKYLAQLNNSLSSDIAKRLQIALNNAKTRISHSTVRQEAIHEANNLDPRQSLATICKYLG